MFIDLHELQLHPVDFTEEFAPGSIDLGPDYEQRTPLKSAGRAELVQERHGKHEKLLDIRLHGNLSTSIESPCARCLEPVAIDVARDFDLLYRPQGSDAGREDLAISAAEGEISYYAGDGIELVDALREQVLLAVPLKSLCREDCQGLCPNCGFNLNQGKCGCAAKPGDSRWAALKDLGKQLEQ